MNATKPSAGGYHHGDARRALLQAADDLLESAGAAGLSLRQVAERAGLSRQAPYHHFADKAALLAELIASGFADLRAAILAGERCGAPPTERLESAASAYIAFAQTRPALFRLMFASELVDPGRHPQVQAGHAAALAVVGGIVSELAPADAAADLTLAAWAMVHGYAVLCLEVGLEAEARRPDRAALFARIIVAAAEHGAARP